MPTRNKPLKFTDLHCGIGSLRLAFEDCGAECVWSYTADAKARRCYRENFGGSTSDSFADIPAHDILVANLDECAATAQRRKSAQRPHEMILDVVCLHRPLACLLAGKADGTSATSRSVLIDDLVRRLGYFVHRAKLDARRFGLPLEGQTDFLVAFDRETGFRFPTRRGRMSSIDNLLDPNPHDRYYISDSSRDKLIARRSRSMNNGNEWRLGFVSDGYANELSDAPDAPYHNILIGPDGRWRVLVDREIARLHGIVDSFVLHPEWRTAQKQLARCIPVPCAVAVAERIVAALRPNANPRRVPAAPGVSRNRKARGSKPMNTVSTVKGLTSPLRWYGSLNGYSSKIVELFPKHESYCEVFGGSAAILLSKPPSKIEIFNDIDEKLVRFWRALREPRLRKRLIEMIDLTPFSRVEFRECLAEQDGCNDPVVGAWQFLVASNQSRNGCAVNPSDWAYNKTEGKNSDAWASLPARLAEVGQRLKRVQVESLPFEDILRRYGATSPDLFFLLDPPFLPETRVSGERYTHECSRDDHIRLLRIARGLKSSVAICGYRSDLYDDLLGNWHRTDIKGKSYAGPRTKGRKLPDRVLSVYTNYGPQALCDPPAVACAKATTTASPLRYYGGLQGHARALVAKLPPHDVYIEPFAGGLSVLLSKPESKTECVSDINPDLINYWRVVQRTGSRRCLLQRLEMTPYSRETFRGCVELLEEGGGNSLMRAWAVAVAHNQSRNGLGVDWSYGKGISNQNAESWAKLPARIELAGRRLRRVRIECLPYQEAVQWFRPRSVVFFDPPYVPSTRVSAKVYLHEFDRKMHQGLLRMVRKLKKPKVILCGYRDEMMDTLDGWRRTDIKTKSFAAPRAKGCRLDERVLSVWTNYDPPSR